MHSKGVIGITERRMMMVDNVFLKDQQASKIAVVSFFLGIGSLVVLAASFVIGILIESIGVLSFFGVVSVLALAAIICGIIGRKESVTKNLPGKRMAITGLVFGAIALFLTLFFRIAVFLFFIPWLGK